MSEVDYLRLAYDQARKSLDPSTQVGAVIINPERGAIALSYNQFTRGTQATEERLNDSTTKYLLTVHAEVVAICDAAFKGAAIDGGHMYCTWQPCFNCAIFLGHAGIKQLVYHQLPEHIRPDWQIDQREGAMVLSQMGVVQKAVTDRLGFEPIRFRGVLLQP